MTKITKLTMDQESRLVEFREEWRKIGLCCNPADFETGDEVIRGFYRRLGKPDPIILHFSSPAMCELAVNFIFAALKDATPKKLRSQLGSQPESQLWSQLRSQLGSQLWSQLESQLGRSSSRSNHIFTTTASAHSTGARGTPSTSSDMRSASKIRTSLSHSDLEPTRSRRRASIPRKDGGALPIEP